MPKNQSLLSAFTVSFFLKNTYKANGIIWALKSTPLIRKFLPSSLYASEGLKSFANVISGLWEFLYFLLGKTIYLFAIFGATVPMRIAAPDCFIHIFIFLTFVGGLINTNIFDPTKDKFYAIFLMRMDARNYTLSNYFYFLLKAFISTLLLGFFVRSFPGLTIISCVLMPFFLLEVKLICSVITLMDCKKDARKFSNSRKKIINLVAVSVLLLAAFFPPYFGFSFSEPVLFVLTAVLLIPAVFSFIYVLNYDSYRAVYKDLLRPEAIFLTASTAGNASQTMMQKKISTDIPVTSTKTGYAYFNEIFMKRHSKLMTKSAKRITIVSFALALLCAALLFIFPEEKADINKFFLTSLPYFMFIMYFINRGRNITQAMFLNCDHSMLAYRFYRQPKALLSLFKERLKYITLINLMPASVIAISLPVLLYLSGGTDNPLNYLVLFVSILAMSVFFSVHSLVLYYLLQPYNVNLEMKSAVYGIVNTITYVICYLCINLHLPTISFGGILIAFCVLYIPIALLLAYRLAPKTFRLRN